MKIGVVGNCQVTGIALSLSRIPGLDIEAIELWNRSEAEIAQIDPSKWDLILAQPHYAERYGPMRYSEMKRLYGARTYWIHSFHLQGATPDCIYVGPADNPLSGPLGHYHSSIVLNAYKQGASASEAASRLEHGDGALDARSEMEASLTRLKNREAAIDVPYAARLEELIYTYRCFWTVNHPLQGILADYAVRIASDALGATLAYKGDWPDLLKAKAEWPVYPWVKESLGLKFEPVRTFGRGGRYYSFSEFVEQCYILYDGNTGELEAKYA